MEPGSIVKRSARLASIMGSVVGGIIKRGLAMASRKKLPLNGERHSERSEESRLRTGETSPAVHE